MLSVLCSSRLVFRTFDDIVSHSFLFGSSHSFLCPFDAQATHLVAAASSASVRRVAQCFAADANIGICAKSSTVRFNSDSSGPGGRTGQGVVRCSVEQAESGPTMGKVVVQKIPRAVKGGRRRAVAVIQAQGHGVAR